MSDCRQRIRSRWATLATLAFAAVASAQQSNPVYVDDSPRAFELLRQAADQTADNAAEAIRLYQEVLDEYAFKLAPITEGDEEHFTSVRRLVQERLRGDPDLLERYRVIESAEASRLLKRDDLRRLAITRGLTEPGLEALLRISQRAIEEARFHAALGSLEEAAIHPSLDPTRAAHCWFMTGLAALYMHDDETRADAEARLAALDAEGPSFLVQLRRLVERGDGPEVTTGVSPLSGSRPAELSDLVAEEIWSVPMRDSLLSRRFSTPSGAPARHHPGREQHRRSGDLMTTAPTVAGPIVYVNEGHTVLALDRFTGRQRWSHVSRHRPPSIERDADQTLDMNFVTVQGPSLVTLTGHASADGRSTDGRVVCLDARTGENRWSRSLDRIGGLDDHEGLFPHGQPVIIEGGVYVLARKVTRQLLTSSYVVALDLETGNLLWAQHVASSGGLRRSARSLSTLVSRDGDLYIATAVGAIARLTADSGEIRWLRRYHVPISPRFDDQSRRPWQVPGPVVADETVIVIQPGERRIVVLDRTTGHTLETFAADSSSWKSPRYLIADDHNLYAVGREIRVFRLGALERPVWQLPAPRRSGDDDAPVVPQRVEIRGRVHLASRSVIVPTLDGVLVLDSGNGSMRHRLPVSAVGNPVAADAQLLLAGSDQLDAFMSFRRAEQMLRGRIVTNPDDPEPALSLLRLGARGDRLDLSLEAATMALLAIERGGALPAARSARAELFSLLLEIDVERATDSVEEGEALFAMIGAVAFEADQQVEYRLAYGRWESAHSLSRAIEHYQAILSDPRLSPVRRAEDGRIRSSSAWAIHRIRELIERHGPGVYAPQDDFARMRVEEIAVPGPRDVARLQALAAELPFSDAAARAAIRASEVLDQRGDPFAAAATLIAAYQRWPQSPYAGDLLGRYAWLCQESGWPAPAAEALAEARRRGTGPNVRTPTGSRNIDAWLHELRATLNTMPPARVGGQDGLAEVLAGRLVPSRGDVPVGRPDRLLLFDGLEVRQHRAEDLAEVWRQPLEDPAPQVLIDNARHVLLWSETNLDDPRGVLLDADTGAEQWTTPPLNRFVGDVVRDLIHQRPPREQMAGGDVFNPKETLPLVGHGGRLIVVQRSGGVVAFDLADATDPLWSVPETLEQIHLARAHEFGVVLAGQIRQVDPMGGRGPLLPRILILDPANGRVRHQIRPLGRSGVKWLRVDPLGRLIYATMDGVEAVDLLSGERQWANITYAAADTQSGHLAGSRFVIEDRESDLRALDLADGSISDRFEMPAHGDWDPLELQQILVLDDAIFARYRQRIVRFDDAGAVAGADTVAEKRDFNWLLPVTDGLILVSRFHTGQEIIPDQAGRRTQHTYRIYTMSPNCMLRGEAIELPPIPQRLVDGRVVDGWLLLSTQTDTMAVPMPGGS